jgi:hypothetical protein
MHTQDANKYIILYILYKHSRNVHVNFKQIVSYHTRDLCDGHTGFRVLENIIHLTKFIFVMKKYK